MSQPAGNPGTNLRYAVDEKPPHLLSAMLGFQVSALIITGIALTPLVVLRAVGMEQDYGAWVVFAALLISGLATMLQAQRIGPLGAGYVLFMGTSGAFIAVGIAAVSVGGLPLLGTLVAVSALLQFLFAARLGLLRRVLTPTVGGTVIMLIAVAVFPVAYGMVTATPPGAVPDSPAGAVLASFTFVVIIGLSLFSRGALRLWAPLIGVVAGCLLALPLGLLDLSPVGTAPWIGLPATGWPGLDLSFGAAFWGLLPAFLIVTLVGAVETYGDGIAIQRISQRRQRALDFKVVQGAVYADGVGNLFSGLAGTLPNTTYSTSISVVDLTGVAARRVGLYGGAVLVLLAFSPKVSALLQAVPSPVVGAFIFLVLTLLFGHGLRLVTEGGLSYENGFVVCVAFWLGMGFHNDWIFPEHLPEWSRIILGNGMTAGAVAAVVMTVALSLRGGPRRRRRLPGTPAAVRDLHDWLREATATLGWDGPALMRLQLAAEEAMLYLLDRAAETRDGATRELSVALEEDEGTVTLEIFIGARTEENLLEQLSALQPQPTRDQGEDAGLRILRGLVRKLEHQQYNEGEYLSLTLDSTPLG